MYIHNTKASLGVFLLCAIFFSAQSAIVISGNGLSAETTFNFALGKYAKSTANGTLFVAAANHAGGSNKAQSFALSSVHDDSTHFEPLTPPTVTLNIANTDQSNPLFDAGFRELALLENTTQGLLLPAAITENKPNVVFLYESTAPKAVSLLESLPARDAQNQIGERLVGLTTDNYARVFSMVKPVGADFGQPGTGIVGFIRGTIDNESKLRVFSQIDLPTGLVLDSSLLRAFPLDVTSEVLKIGGNNLSAINEVASLYWDPVLQRLFIGLEVATGSQAGNGARSVVVGRLENNALHLSPIAPDSAFDTSINNIVGGINLVNNSLALISAHSIKTMHTSTGLSYLIVQGGQGQPSETEFTLYALPLVSGASASLVGTIAATNALPINMFQPGPANVPLFAQRNLMSPATTPQTLPSATDREVFIGGDSLRAGRITDIFVQGDTVFVAVANEVEPQFSGIYYSRALFASDGKISGWTLWQLMHSSNELVFGAMVNSSDIATIFITQDEDEVVNTVKKTNWSIGDQQNFGPASAILNNFFLQKSAGITSVVNFEPDIPGIDVGFHPTGIGAQSVWCAGGDGMLAFVQTGFVDAQLILPFRGDDFSTVQTFDNGIIDNDVHSAVVLMRGGVLDTIGFVSSIDVAVSVLENQAWFVVGGTGGVAILSRENGAGWNAVSGIGDHFSSLIEGMSFKLVGDYSFVNKIVADGDFLYVLTNDRLDRINIRELNGGVGTARAVTIATLDQLGLPSTGTFLDLIVSQSLGLLATSDMLFCIGDGLSVSQISQNQSSAWKRVVLPEGVTPIRQLATVTLTGRAQDITRNLGGNVLVLGADQGNDQAVLSRLAIQALDDDQPVGVDTVTPLPDVLVQNRPTNFLNFGRFIDQLATDGGVYMATQDATVNSSAMVRVASFVTQPQVGRPAIGSAMQPVKALSSLGNLITSLQRNIGSGAWMITGDFGLRVNE